MSNSFLTLFHFSMEDTTCQDLRSSCEYLERLIRARSASMDLELNMGCWLGNTLFFQSNIKLLLSGIRVGSSATLAVLVLVS